MKKLLCFVVLMLCSLSLFAGCGVNDYKTAGTEFVENIFAEDYDSAAKQMEATFAESFTTDTMQEMADSIIEQNGAYEKVISSNLEKNEDYPDYQMAAVYVQFAEGKMQFVLAYNENKELCGLNVYGSDISDTSTEDVADYRSVAKDFLQAIFDGDTASAYAMLSDDAKAVYTEDNLAVLKTEAESTYGTFDSFGPTSQSGYSVSASVDFADGNVTFTFELNETGQIDDITTSVEE